MKIGYKIEVFLWMFVWTVETLLIKYWVGVESWFFAIILAVTLGSLVVKAIQHIPSILE